jgi:adenine-specific DNA methylase
MESKSIKDALNENIILSNQNEKLLVELEELERKYNALHKTFLNLLEISLEYRERMGIETNRDFEYDQLEKAKLL